MPNLVPTHRFSDAALPPSRQRELFRERLSGSWDAELIDHGAGLATESSAWNMGDIVIAAGRYPRRRILRRRAHARSDQLDHYSLQVPLGATRVRADADGEAVAATPGQPLLMDLSREADVHCDAGTSVLAFFPRETIDELLPGPCDLHGLSLHGAAASLLGHHMASLAARLPELPMAQAQDVAKATLHLVAASIAPSVQTLERARPALQAGLLRQACRFIELHLQDEDLSAARICSALKVSRATLYRLFEPLGGVANHVRERRLVRAHELITDPARQRPIARIAEEFGYSDPSDFCRAFRRQFGCSPREAGAGVPSSQPAAPQGEGEVLTNWLRSLR